MFDTNLAEVLSNIGAKFGEKPAIIFEGRDYTFAEIDEEVKKYASFLKNLGVKKGNRVALQLPKCMEFIFLHLANLSLGGITIPLNTGYTPPEIKYFISNSKSSLFFTDNNGLTRTQSVLEELKGNVRTFIVGEQSPRGILSISKELLRVGTSDCRTFPTSIDDLAMICYTSGTTGKPKGAMITHGNLISNMRALKEVWQWTDSDVLLHVLPIFHVHGLNVALNGGLYCGSTIIMHEKFDPPKVWSTIQENKSTMFMGVPTMYYRLMNEWDCSRYDLSSMRIFISGSAPLSENLFYRFEAATGFRILERYGMTETQMIASNPYASEQRITKSVGYPLPGIKIRVMDELGEDVPPGQAGEVWIKGENVFKGYWQMPEATEKSFADGWFKSGDLGYQEPADFMRLYLVGRAKELIISGGYNVYPKEIETVLEQQQAVEEAAVFGMPDSDLGEKVVAAVVLRKSTPEVSEQELIRFCKNKLAGYKCPKQVYFVDALPRNAMGKIQKNLLQEIL